MAAYATVNDLALLWRRMTAEEQTRAAELLDIVSAEIRLKGKRCGKDVDSMAAADADYSGVLKSVVCDVVARSLISDTDAAPMTQFSQSAGGYSVSGTFLNAGGGIFVKKSEWSRLGLRNQSYGGLSVYGSN